MHTANFNMILDMWKCRNCWQNWHEPVHDRHL